MSDIHGAADSEKRVSAEHAARYLTDLLAHPHDFWKLYRKHLPYPPQFHHVHTANGVIRFRCFDRPAEIILSDDRFEVWIHYEFPCMASRIPLLSRLLHLVHARIDMGCFHLDPVSGSLSYCTSWYTGSAEHFEETAVAALCWPVVITNHYAATFLPLMCGCEPSPEDTCIEYQYLLRAYDAGKENV